VLGKMGMAKKDVYTRLENRMNCGVGKCARYYCTGRCQLRPRLRLQRRPYLLFRTAQPVA